MSPVLTWATHPGSRANVPRRTPVSPVARAICQALLDHHRHSCRTDEGGARPAESCLITYGVLGRQAVDPAVVRTVGLFLRVVGVGCQEKGSPPLNALAVNQDSRMPGDNYEVAPGCSLLDWPTQAQACIAFTGYPASVPLPP